jgi:hypothetical protein
MNRNATAKIPDDFARPPKWWIAADILLVLAVFYLVAPSPPPGVNEPHYLCRLRHAVDPTYCPGDLFLESPDAHATFVLVLAPLARLMDFETLAWLGRLVNWAFMAWAWCRLSWAVVPRPLFAPLAAALMLAGIAEGNFAGEWLVKGFEAKTIAYVFVLLGLRAWLLNKWNWAWIHFGIASAWHALVGGWSVVILLGLWLVGWRREQSFAAMLPGLLIGGAISLAGVLPALALSAGVDAELKSEAAEVYVFERLPHHLAPLHKPAFWIAERATRHSTVAMLMALLLVVRLHTLRSANTSIRDDSATRIALYAIGAMVLAMIGLAIEFTLWNHSALSASLLRYYWFRLVDVAVPMAMALLWIRLLADMMADKQRHAPAMLALLLVLSGTIIGTRFYTFVKNPVADSDAPTKPVGDWLDICDWVRTETPTDAMFLTPRGGSSFKWHAERAEVVTYKDVPQNAEGLVEWRRRLYEVFKPAGDASQPWVAGVGELGTPRVLELAEKYGIDYVLTTRDSPLSLPVAYDNATYVVYEIPKHEP